MNPRYPLLLAGLCIALAIGKAGHAGHKDHSAIPNECSFWHGRASATSYVRFDKALADFIPEPNLRKRVGGGAEGDVYVSPSKPKRALKVWREGDQFQFTSSVGKLVAMAEALATKRAAALECCLHVVAVYQTGPNWIEREFFPKSVPLREAMKTDGLARVAFRKVMAALEKLRDRQPFALLYSKLKEEKPNFHWDAESKHIVVIDSQ
jgi:hypothetical protein